MLNNRLFFGVDNREEKPFLAVFNLDKRKKRGY
jgi:hypothetical protein